MSRRKRLLSDQKSGCAPGYASEERDLNDDLERSVPEDGAIEATYRDALNDELEDNLTVLPLSGQ
jgi:hypothetical protein